MPAINVPPSRQIKAILKEQLPIARTLGAGVELLVYIDYLHFMRRLNEEAGRAAIREGCARVSAAHIAQAKVVVLNELEGEREE